MAASPRRQRLAKIAERGVDRVNEQLDRHGLARAGQHQALAFAASKSFAVSSSQRSVEFSRGSVAEPSRAFSGVIQGGIDSQFLASASAKAPIWLAGNADRWSAMPPVTV